MTASLRVFVNGAGVDVPPGASALDAVRAFDGAAADAVARGEQIVTDSRGLPTDAASPVRAGAIFRLIPNRGRSAADPAEEL